MKFLDTNDLVSRYNNRISAGTIANWRASGKGPRFRKIGGRVLYTIEDVEAWEDTRTHIMTGMHIHR